MNWRKNIMVVVIHLASGATAILGKKRTVY